MNTRDVIFSLSSPPFATDRRGFEEKGESLEGRERVEISEGRRKERSGYSNGERNTSSFMYAGLDCCCPRSSLQFPGFGTLNEHTRASTRTITRQIPAKHLDHLPLALSLL
jgi:hypothetical protein